MRFLALIVVAAAVVLAGPRVEAADSIWQASSGALPDSACPRWTASISDSAPQLSPASLRIRTTECSRSISYRQVAPDIQIPATLEVEARLRLESRGECVGPCGHYRDAASINITTAPQVGTLFFVGQDQIFLTNGECNGITSAGVDTDNSAHTYRVVVSSAGAVTVYYDGTPTLTGHTYTSASDHASAPRILWGEGSFLAYGTSHWEYVKHNAHATGCVATSVEGAAIRTSGLSAWPNPFSPETTLRYAIAQPTRVHIDLFDVSGRWVRSLLDADSSPGDHQITWDGLDATGRVVSAGPYLYRVTTADGERTGKVLRLP